MAEIITPSQAVYRLTMFLLSEGIEKGFEQVTMENEDTLLTPENGGYYEDRAKAMYDDYLLNPDKYGTRFFFAYTNPAQIKCNCCGKPVWLETRGVAECEHCETPYNQFGQQYRKDWQNPIDYED